MVLWRDTVLRTTDGLVARLEKAVATAVDPAAAEASLCGPDGFNAILVEFGDQGEAAAALLDAASVGEVQERLGALARRFSTVDIPAHWSRQHHGSCCQASRSIVFTLLQVACRQSGQSRDPGLLSGLRNLDAVCALIMTFIESGSPPSVPKWSNGPMLPVIRRRSRFG